MERCDQISTCTFFKTAITEMPTVAEMMKKRYCYGDFDACVQQAADAVAVEVALGRLAEDRRTGLELPDLRRRLEPRAFGHDIRRSPPVRRAKLPERLLDRVRKRLRSRRRRLRVPRSDLSAGPAERGELRPVFG